MRGSFAGVLKHLFAGAAQLRDVRQRHDLSPMQMAIRIGVPRATLQIWEQGSDSPGPAVLSLARIFDRNPQIVADALFEPL